MTGAATGRRQGRNAVAVLPTTATALLFPLVLALLGAMLASLPLLLLARPAAAVQTTTFSLTPTDERTSIVVYADSGMKVDHFVLHNLKAKPISIALRVLSLAKFNGAFVSGPPGVGFAAQVRLGNGQVTLGPGQTVTLPVHIDTDYPHAGNAEHFAVIDAYQVTPLHSGINVVPHLRLAIELKPSQTARPSGTSSGWSGGKTAAVIVAGLLLLAGLVAWLVAVARRRAAGR